MNGLLERFVAVARQRARGMRATGIAAGPRRDFVTALRGKSLVRLIAEFKRRSPSVGPLAIDADPALHAKHVFSGGASAMSVLTEPVWFGGCCEDLVLARAAVPLPVLAKDFFVEPIQVEVAAGCADAVLLIARCLPGGALAELAAAAATQCLAILIECHDEVDLERALAIPDAVIGVNNRCLDTLQVDIMRAVRLLPQVPKERVAVAESGYRSATEIGALRGLADAVLVGTSLMQGVSATALTAGGAA